MYFKFLQHGKGDPAKAAAYVVDKVDHLNRPRAGVSVLRGDPQTFATIAGSIQNEWLYTSGVIAWSKTDDPSDEEISAVLDEFEKHAFAGLQPDQYHFTAVLHQEDDGSKHVHFLVPRIELDTGKALNIAPPGHEYYFDPLRDYFNYKHGWSRPDDPALQHDVQLPDHLHLINAAALSAGIEAAETKNDVRELITDYLKQRIEYGFIRNRQDILEALSEVGEFNRTSDNYITVILPKHGKTRLRGAIYESDFTLESYLENRTREEADARASRENRVISEEHKQLAADNLDLVRERAKGRAEYNAERYFKLERANEESAFNRVRQHEHNAVNDSTLAAQQSSPAASRTVDSKHTSAVRPAAQAAQAAQIHADSRDFAVSDFNFNSAGEMNERLKNIDESTSRTLAEASRATDSCIAEVRELQQAVDQTKRAFDSREPSQIRVNFDAERADSKHQIEETIGRFFTDVRIQHESAFTNAVKESVRSIEPTAHSQSIHSEQNQSITATTFGTDIETFITEYSIKQRDERRRAIQQDTELRRINQQLGETDRKLNVISRLLDHPKFAIRPKSSIEMTDYFKSIGYRSPTAKNIHSWSEKQHESFRKGDINQVAYYIGCKYNELSHFSRYEKGLNRDEIDIVQKNLRNDERIIDFMKKKGCHLNYDNRERLDRTFKLERYANESRLNDLVQKENTVQPIVQVKPEPKALDQDQDNGLTM
ncbi:relaxase/mobilization nuclease domain-containing protein [Acinetobacter baumannii]|uniref:relaxase/mobilization nuclease domain-containing protein n=1 Tax=Acinetobacter baumannii TaxID=470 RepID=UPI003891BF22